MPYTGITSFTQSQTHLWLLVNAMQVFRLRCPSREIFPDHAVSDTVPLIPWYSTVFLYRTNHDT